MVKPIIPGSLDALTIFKGMKGWQISWQVKGQHGYSVNQVDESVARRFMDMLSGLSTEPPEIRYLEPVSGTEAAIRRLIDLLDRLNQNVENELDRLLCDPAARRIVDTELPG